MVRSVPEMLAGRKGMRFRDDESADATLMPDWIKFVAIDLHDKRLTKVWSVLTVDGKHCLGQIGWYRSWRRYSFSPSQSNLVILEWECMRKIADFCEQATKDRKLERQDERKHGIGYLRDKQIHQQER